MSLGGLRDPTDPSRDTYSKLEADAVAFAVSKGVLVVAAVGNGDQAPSQPWPYASWPAALPHVLGVSALSRKGSSPAFSNRDPRFNDIAAPGEEILSTFPLQLTANRPECVEQGYSSCGPEEYRSAEGTSFATPQVTAAAAVLFATSPGARARPGARAARAERGRRSSRQRLRRVHERARPFHRCGAARPGRCARPARGRGSAAGPLRAERRRRQRGVPALRGRREVAATSTTGTTATTSTGSTCGRRAAAATCGARCRDPRRSRSGVPARQRSTPPRSRTGACWPSRRRGARFRARAAGWYLLDARMLGPAPGAYRLTVAKTR